MIPADVAPAEQRHGRTSGRRYPGRGTPGSEKISWNLTCHRGALFSRHRKRCAGRAEIIRTNLKLPRAQRFFDLAQGLRSTEVEARRCQATKAAPRKVQEAAPREAEEEHWQRTSMFSELKILLELFLAAGCVAEIVGTKKKCKSLTCRRV